MSTDKERLVDEVDAFFHAVFKPMRPGPPRLTPLAQDLTMGQLRALFVLAHEAPLGIGALAERLGVGLPAASRMVDRMLQDELVERWEDPSDRRRALVRLADRGRQVIEEIQEERRGAIAQVEERLRRLLAQLPEEKLTRLRDGMEAVAQAAAVDKEPE
ncbi:MAG TPA: MarR family transcriptional regulator [Chloroflexota bacterium]|nr:MarR family transcriptional regulator [Chloroflexota bacterium]